MITTLTGLGVTAAAIPLAATACSDNKSSTDVAKAFIIPNQRFGNAMLAIAGSEEDNTVELKAGFVNANADPVINAEAKWSLTAPNVAGATFSIDQNTGVLSVNTKDVPTPTEHTVYELQVSVECKANSKAKDTISFYVIVLPKLPEDLSKVTITNTQEGESYLYGTAGEATLQSRRKGFDKGYTWNIMNGDQNLYYDIPLVYPEYIVTGTGRILTPEQALTANHVMFGVTPIISYDKESQEFSVDYRAFMDATDHLFVSNGIEFYRFHFAVTDRLGLV